MPLRTASQPVAEIVRFAAVESSIQPSTPPQEHDLGFSHSTSRVVDSRGWVEDVLCALATASGALFCIMRVSCN